MLPTDKLTPLDGVTPADDDLRLWGVTTLLNVLDKPALIYWAANTTAEAAVAGLEVVTAMAKKDQRDAVKWLTEARFRKPAGSTRTAAELGTAVHTACEDYALTGTRPEVDAEVLPYLDQFDAWAQRFQPIYHAAEATVFSPTWGYAGTLDAILELDGVLFLTDYKTSRKSYDGKGQPTKPYPEQVALQLAAYRYADFLAAWRPRRTTQFRRRYYLLSDAERAMALPIPEVDTGLCVHITPEHCVAYPVECGEAVHQSFLHVVEAAAWVMQGSTSVLGDPLDRG